jgi:peptidoglycan hydrolase-like protein with peptidoglycan-binding domain
LYSYGSGSSCYCNSGYTWNSSKTACVVQSSTYIAPPVSPTTYTTSASTGTSCSSFGAGGVLKGSLCYCAVGYKWNKTITACVAGNTVLQRNLNIGSSGSDVVALKNLLAVLNLYNGYVSTAFYNDTATAVGLFQVAHNIPWTGTVGPMTRKVINGLLSGS